MSQEIQEPNYEVNSSSVPNLKVLGQIHGFDGENPSLPMLIEKNRGLINTIGLVPAILTFMDGSQRGFEARRGFRGLHQDCNACEIPDNIFSKISDFFNEGVLKQLGGARNVSETVGALLERGWSIDRSISFLENNAQMLHEAMQTDFHSQLFEIILAGEQ